MNFPLAPEQASTFAGYHDFVFYTLVILTLFFTVVVGFFVILFTVRYRSGSKVDRSRPVHENNLIEIGWSLPPLILGIAVFWVGADLFVQQRRAPKDAMEIFVIGKQWMWHIQHPNGVRENNTLHVPVGVPVKLTMISQDVLHAFYIPEFRIQYHVVPGRYTQQWFQASKPGKYHIFCAMYCGTQHSEMIGTVYAMPKAEYAKWIENGGNDVKPMTMAERGAELYGKLACNNCHTATDTPRGPSLYGLAGKTRRFADGSSAVADLPYLREAILRPWDRLNEGYTQTMPAYEGQISERDLTDLMAFIGTMSASPGTVSGAPHAGNTPANSFTPREPVGSVGAMASEQPKNEGVPKQGNLAVGAIGAQQVGNR